MKSYVIFLFFLFVFSARLAGQHTLPVKWHMEIYDAALPAKRHTRRMDKK